MDDAARLVLELRDRLAELDGKVAAYQRDMLAEFHRHMDECLRKYPDDVSSEVSRTVTASVFAGDYPSLSPSHLRDASRPPLTLTTRPPVSPAIVNSSTSRGTWGSPGGRKSPPPILRHTSGTPMEGSRSPHAREKEFQGLFTPTYLPLLENDSRRSSLHSPPMSPPPTSEGSPLPLSTDNVDKVNKALAAAQDPKPPALTTNFDNRPVPLRRLTDRSEASSSLESYGSESNITTTSKGRRRSALRRSSSSNKDSPRRVRFEFEGEEIFPASSSPRTPTAMTFTDESGAAEAQAPTATATAAATAEAEAESLEFATEQDNVDRVQGNGDDESITYSGTSLLDVEGEEDAFPKPKKVSSTQALQALTRSPLEEGTTWRVVNPDPEEVPPSSMNGEKVPERPKGLTTRNDSQATIRPNGNGYKVVDQDTRVYVDEVVQDVDDDSDSEEGDEDEEEDEEDSASEDEFLSIPIRRKPTSPPSDPGALPARPPNLTRPTLKAAEPAQPQQSESASLDNSVDDDPFFEFDDEVGGPSSSSPQKHQKYLPDPDSSDEDPTPGRLRKAAREEQQRLQQQQAGGDTVSSPSGPTTTNAKANTNATPMSPSSALFDHSIGSYMGRSVTIAPIKDAKLYDEIAEMRDVRFSVGSLKDVTGIEAAAMGSYRASAPSLARDSGFTPRSFSERLVLEDEMERRRVAGEGGDDEF
ncbi:uncharacterized protein C8A04DRAFT_35011 [Dichotomopilus funicola]|uniref:Uncharacterized protein n=1 Tax=Dichotomopilus funicola TaxID=1934379 RepID=A0AAN6ZQ88_9PEZI|nr:hypothetical protein C8A04DRAFT_35011 [Dichotomopilus funicola]